MDQPRHSQMSPPVPRVYFAHSHTSQRPYTHPQIPPYAQYYAEGNQYEPHHLRLDLHHQQQQQQQQQQQYPNYTPGMQSPGYFHSSSSPSGYPPFNCNWASESPSVSTVPFSDSRPRASSRSSGSSAESSTSPPHVGGPSSDIEDSPSRKSSKIEVINSSCYSPRSPTEPDYLLTATDSVICGEEPRTSEDVSQIIDDGNQRVSQVYRTATRSQQQDTSGSSTGRPKRRPNNQGADGQSKFRRSHRQESYVLRRLEEDDIDLPEQEASEPLFTLEDSDYRDVFTALGSLFCKTSYRWLALYKFRIPKKRNMRDHLRPDDREMTEYVTIIKTLVEQREVPRNAVRDDRLNELVSIMEGASEIRHVNIHVSRKKKPDRRVLGFIAAVNEFCWILGDQRGARETNQLYYKIEALTMEKRRKFQEQEQAKQAALLQAMDKDQEKGKATLPAQERIDGDSARNGWMDGC